MRGESWLNAAGLATWLVSGLPTAVDISTGRLSGWPAIVWSAAFVAFGAAFAVCLRARPFLQGRTIDIGLLAIQTLAGLTMVHVSGNSLAAACLVVVAGEVPYRLPTRGALTWVGVQSALLTAEFLAQASEWTVAASAGGAYACFQLFALTTASLARSERAAREELAAAHAELLATRSLLAENSRVAERLRISRDLHDMLGHHLTALSLQLDVASRLASGQAAQHVIEAHAITRLLLSDVRDVVSRLRDAGRIDLAAAVRGLVAPGGTLQIRLDMPSSLEMDDASRANALLRCVQEIITNAARHAEARNLWIRLDRRAEGIELHAHDDGRGADEPTWGNGLTGMRERFEEYAGRIEFTSASGRGFEVHGFMPGGEVLS